MVRRFMDGALTKQDVTASDDWTRIFGLERRKPTHLESGPSRGMRSNSQSTGKRADGDDWRMGR